MIRFLADRASRFFSPMAMTCLALVSGELAAQQGAFPTAVPGQPTFPTAAPLAQNPQQIKVQKLLAIHRALADGQDLLRRGQHIEAVAVLEKELPNIEGDREYLRSLQDAYHGAIQDLARKGNSVEADMYLKRLGSLQSGSTVATSVAPLGASSPNVSMGTSGQGLPALAGGTPPAVRQDSSVVPATATPQMDAKPLGRVQVLSAQGAPGQPVAQTLADAAMKPGDDPFARTNFTPEALAQAPPRPEQRIALNAPAVPIAHPTMAQADKAFRQGQFAIASKLFEKASLDGARVEGVDRERWGYCKMAALVESFNQGQVHEAMIVEVDQAVTLSPRLTDLGKQVRSQVMASLSDTGRKGSMDTARTPASEIRRVQGIGQWQAVESTWFRVFHQGSESVATEVARQADLAKAAASQRWLGHEGEAWPYRCDIWLYPTGEMYSRATGVGGNSPGHSTFKAENTRVLERKIELRMDHPNLVDAVLPHEVTHVVLAGQFGKNFLPRWLDEGMAILAEPRTRIKRHTDHLPRYASEGTLLSAAQLMTLADYPDAGKVGIFYAQSVSLVDYLCSLKGTQSFTQFVKEAIHGDWEAALRRHYNIAGFEALDRQWKGEWVAAGR